MCSSPPPGHFHIVNGALNHKAVWMVSWNLQILLDGIHCGGHKKLIANMLNVNNRT